MREGRPQVMGASQSANRGVLAWLTGLAWQVLEDLGTPLFAQTPGYFPARIWGHPCSLKHLAIFPRGSGIWGHPCSLKHLAIFPHTTIPG